jgi:hypothetical protein
MPASFSIGAIHSTTEAVTQGTGFFNSKIFFLKNFVVKIKTFIFAS